MKVDLLTLISSFLISSSREAWDSVESVNYKYATFCGMQVAYY